MQDKNRLIMTCVITSLFIISLFYIGVVINDTSFNDNNQTMMEPDTSFNMATGSIMLYEDDCTSITGWISATNEANWPDIGCLVSGGGLQTGINLLINTGRFESANIPYISGPYSHGPMWFREIPTKSKVGQGLEFSVDLQHQYVYGKMGNVVVSLLDENREIIVCAVINDAWYGSTTDFCLYYMYDGDVTSYSAIRRVYTTTTQNFKLWYDESTNSIMINNLATGVPQTLVSNLPTAERDRIVNEISISYSNYMNYNYDSKFINQISISTNGILNAWYGDYKYRQSHELSWTVPGTYYANSFEVHYGFGISSPFYGNKMYVGYESDYLFRDIVFTDVQGNRLDADKVACVDSDYAVFHVKIPYSSTGTTVYIFYGGPTVMEEPAGTLRDDIVVHGDWDLKVIGEQDTADYLDFKYMQVHEVLGLDIGYCKAIMKLKMFYAQGTSYLDRVYLSGVCENTFEDIRFVALDSAGNEYPLNYAVVDVITGVSATFYVEVKGLVEALGGSAYFGVKYGSVSDEVFYERPDLMSFSVFEEFDEPLDTSNDWIEYEYGTTGGSHSKTYSNGELGIYAYSNADTHGYLWESINTFTYPFTVEVDARFTNLDSYRGGGPIIGVYVTDTHSHVNGLWPELHGDYQFDYIKCVDGVWECLNPITNRNGDIMFLKNALDSNSNYIMSIESFASGTNKTYAGQALGFESPFKFYFGTYLDYWSLSPVEVNKAYYDYVIVRGYEAKHGIWSVPTFEGDILDETHLQCFEYRQKHTLTPTAGAGTDNIIKFVVSRLTGTSTGNTVYLQGNSQSDYGDVRFTDSEGVMLDYWCEEMDSFIGLYDYVTFWVKMPHDLSTQSQDIWIYWGNDALEPISNGKALFDFFDGFNMLSNATWEIETGVAYPMDTYPFNTYGVLTIEPDSVINANWFSTPISTEYGLTLRYRARHVDSYARNEIGFYQNIPTAKIALSLFDGYARIKTQTEQTGGPFVDDGWYTWEMFWNNGHYAMGYLDDYPIGTMLGDSVPHSGELHIKNLDSEGDLFIDWIYVTECKDNNPGHGSWGVVENLMPSANDYYIDVKFLWDNEAKAFINTFYLLTEQQFLTSLLNEMNAYVADMLDEDMGSITFYNPLNLADPDWNVFDYDGVVSTARSGVGTWINAWSTEWGWHSTDYGNSDRNWKRLDMTDPANAYTFDWTDEYCVVDIYDMPIGKQFFDRPFTGMYSSANGIHGQKIDLLVMITCDYPLRWAVGSTGYGIMTDTIWINLSNMNAGYSICIDEFHMSHFSEFSAGVFNTIRHELGHIFGIEGPEALNQILPYPWWSPLGYMYNGAPYLDNGTIGIEMHGLTYDIMDYFDGYHSITLNARHQEIFLKYIGLHSEFIPVFKWGISYDMSYYGIFPVGNKWTFSVQPIYF